MSTFDAYRLSKLQDLARQRFDSSISDAEFGILRDSSSSENLKNIQGTFDRPCVRADFVRWLLTEPDVATFIDPKGLWIRSVSFDTKLDLSRCQFARILVFSNCHFKESLEISGSELRGLYFYECRADKDIIARAIRLHGHVMFHLPKREDEVRSEQETSLRIAGKLDFDRANIEGMFDACGIQFQGNGDLLLTSAYVGADVYLKHYFRSEGTVNLSGTTISGDLKCEDGEFRITEFINMEIRGGLYWYNVKSSPLAQPGLTLKLSGTKVRRLVDDIESWPPPERLFIRGFSYDDLTLYRESAKTGLQIARRRVEWLQLQTPDDQLEPQPWLELARFVESKGDKSAAKWLILNLRRKQALKCVWPLDLVNLDPGKGVGSFIAYWLLKPLQFIARVAKAAYVYLQIQPLWIVVPIIAIIAAGTFIFGTARRAQTMAPTESAAYCQYVTKATLPSNYPLFNPTVYTLESTLPLSKLGQVDKWAPDPDPSHGERRFVTSYRFLSWSRWLIVLAGYGLATIFATAIASQFKS